MQANTRLLLLNNQLRRSFTSESSSKVLLKKGRNVVGVSLNNPKALNALDLDMIHAIGAQLSGWNDPKSDTKIVYFRGEGGKAFCAGGDIMSLYKADPNQKFLTPFSGKNFYLIIISRQ